MLVTRTHDALTSELSPRRPASVGLVPTMGALHEGHLSLVSAARQDCDKVVASLFVNPTQFGDGEDFTRYPRDEARDLDLFREYGVDIVYAPGLETIYPDGSAVTVRASDLARGLCGDLRPGHFDGVVTVVSRLLAHCSPDRAYFGEKDYQQLKVIERMVQDLDLPVQIVGMPIIREPDGLALSSRNTYLTAGQRRIAPVLFETISSVASDLGPGDNLQALCARSWNRLLDAGFDQVDYLEVRDSEMLAPAVHYRSGLRVFAAAWLGRTRLIDNLQVS